MGESSFTQVSWNKTGASEHKGVNEEKKRQERTLLEKFTDLRRVGTLRIIPSPPLKNTTPGNEIFKRGKESRRGGTPRIQAIGVEKPWASKGKNRQRITLDHGTLLTSQQKGQRGGLYQV